VGKCGNFCGRFWGLDWVVFVGKLVGGVRPSEDGATFQRVALDPPHQHAYFLIKKVVKKVISFSITFLISFLSIFFWWQLNFHKRTSKKHSTEVSYVFDSKAGDRMKGAGDKDLLGCSSKK
jgi:hypothetical protein